MLLFTDASQFGITTMKIFPRVSAVGAINDIWKTATKMLVCICIEYLEVPLYLTLVLFHMVSITQKWWIIVLTVDAKCMMLSWTIWDSL